LLIAFSFSLNALLSAGDQKTDADSPAVSKNENKKIDDVPTEPVEKEIKMPNSRHPLSVQQRFANMKRDVS
jgi:hypothetical protein